MTSRAIGIPLLALTTACGGPESATADADVDATADSALDSAPDTGLNLLRNSDFEQLDGTNWAVDWDNMDANPDGEIVIATFAHSGSRSVQWQIDAAGSGREYWITQHGLTQLEPGHTYVLAGWYHVDEADDVALNYIVRGQPGDTPDLSNIAETPVYPTVADQWSEFRFEITIPADAAPTSWEVSLHSIKFNTVATTLTVDHVRLFER